MDIVSSHVTQNKVAWDNDFSGVYVENLPDLLAEADLNDDVSREQYDVDVITNTIIECLVSAAKLLERTFLSSIPSKRKGRWFDKEGYIKKVGQKSFTQIYSHSLKRRCPVM